MTTDDLIRMANQIDDNFRAYPEEEAVQEIAGHLKAFWDPRMLADLSAAIAAGRAAQLQPRVLTALERI